MKQYLPMNLQFFAEGGDDGGAGGQNGNQQQNQDGGGQSGAANIDYDKIANILDGRLKTTEDSVLKGYFKDQGLSKEEIDQAIAQFKSNKAASQPNPEAIQTQLTQAQAAALQAQLDKAATLEAIGLGVDTKTMPYLLKLADLSNAVDDKGKISQEEVKKALNKVLEDVPALKQKKENGGAFQFGAAGSGTGGTGGNDADALKQAFGV